MIILDDGYVIEATDVCYTLVTIKKSYTSDGKPKKDKNGNPVMTRSVKGYFSSLNKAILAYSDELDRKVVKDGSMSLKQAVAAIMESRESVKKMIREAIPDIEVK